MKMGTDTLIGPPTLPLIDPDSWQTMEYWRTRCREAERELELLRLSKDPKRKRPPAQGEPLRHGRVELFPDHALAIWCGKRVPLSFSQFKMTYVLVKNVDVPVSFRDLYNVVWGENFLAGRGDRGFWTNVRTHVKRIRGGFKQVDPRFRQIGVMSSFGYRWESEEASNVDSHEARGPEGVLQPGQGI